MPSKTDSLLLGDRWPALASALVFAAIFVVYGVYAPYFPVWLSARGLGAPEIAIVLSTPLLLRLAVTPAIGWLADGRSDRRALMAGLATVALASAFMLPLVHGFWPVLVLTSTMMMALNPTQPLADATIGSLVRRGVLRSYGRIRLWGSISFAVIAVVGGFVLTMHGIDVVFMMMIGTILIMGLVAVLLPSASTEVRRKPPPFLLWQRKAFLVVLAALMLISASQAMFFSFSSVHALRLGYPDWSLGVLWAVAVAAEVVVLWYAPGALLRLGPYRLMLIAATATALRWLGMGLDPPVWGAALLQLLHAGTMSCALIAQMAFIERLVEDEASARAQSAVATGHGLLTVAMLAIIGPFYERLGGGAYFVVALLPVAALVLLIVCRPVIESNAR